MRKLLREYRWWIALALGIFIAANVVAFQQHKSAAKYQAHRAGYCTTLGGTAKEQESCKEEKYDYKSELPWWGVLYAWPEGITTWAILATGFIIAWQSAETRKAADASASSAKAANRAQSIQRNQNRPRIGVSVLDMSLEPKNTKTRIEVTFECPTTAWIKSIDYTATVRRANDNTVELIAGEKIFYFRQANNMTITGVRTEVFEMRIRGLDGAHGISSATIEQFNAGELVVSLSVNNF